VSETGVRAIEIGYLFEGLLSGVVALFAFVLPLVLLVVVPLFGLLALLKLVRLLRQGRA
jgi:chromate transport protein ChrA